MQQQRELHKKKTHDIMEDKKSIKKAVMQEMKALKPPPNATPEQAIECLVKQAQFYTNFLLSKHQTRHNQKQQTKKRGHFDEEDEEIENLIEEEQHEDNNNIFTRLDKQPAILKGGQLKYYQLVALNWMISLYQSGISGILADDMGLGKTIQTISILGFLKESKNVKGPHIVVAPKITLGNWMKQFEKWLPSMKVVKLIATKDERFDILENIVDKGKFDVIVTSYEGVRICLSNLKKIKWHYIVIDEAHKIKNQESRLSQMIRKLNNECKLLLTGTPLQNNLKELWSLMNFLLPEIFSSSELFENWFDNQSQEGMSENQIEKKNADMIGKLHRILRPFMLRRTKKDVQKSLPEKKEVSIYVGLTQVQRKIYQNLLQNRNASQEQKKHYLNLLMQLRKVCNHPYLFPKIEAQDAPPLGEHLIETSGKLIILDRLLKKLFVEKTHKVLVFSQMTAVLDILEDYCIYRQYQYCRIDGSTDMNSRDEQIEEFMAEGSKKFIFLLSTRAGGLGINLTAADTVVIYDSDFNPQMDLQAMDRAHRIGQKNIVNVYRLITQNTVEQKIIERQMIKLKWDSLVIQQQQKNNQKNKALTKQQMKQMLTYGAKEIFKSTNGTISEEQIDQILTRGQNKTNQLNREVQERLKNQQSNLVDFSMNSINIFEFMQQDEKKKREDEQALDEIMAKQLQQAANDFRTTRRQKGKNVNYTFQNKIKKQQKIMKKITVPQFQFFHNKDILQQLLQKLQDFENGDQSQYDPLTEQQEKLKQDLMKTGFTNWTRNDFNNFISSNEKFGRKSLDSIASYVNKPLQEIKKYAAVFWERIDELSEKERIVKQIQGGEDKIESKKYHEELLEWKASRCYEIDFNAAVYTKFKSKLFSIDADRFLAQNIYREGIKNMTIVKQKIREESMFRFDHFFRSRSESQLNKRMLSIYKLIEKQKDNDEYGLDSQAIRQSKKMQKRKKKEQKQKLGKIYQQEEVNQENQKTKSKKSKKEKKQNKEVVQPANQILITNYKKPTEQIRIDSSD